MENPASNAVTPRAEYATNVKIGFSTNIVPKNKIRAGPNSGSGINFKFFLNTSFLLFNVDTNIENVNSNNPIVIGQI
jgi:hypothetical protein